MALLREHNVVFEHFDILEDEEVRQGLKKFSNWPTYPQVRACALRVCGLCVRTGACVCAARVWCVRARVLSALFQRVALGDERARAHENQGLNA